MGTSRSSSNVKVTGQKYLMDFNEKAGSRLIFFIKDFRKVTDYKMILVLHYMNV